MAVIFVFVDGVGLAPFGPDNPLATAPTPALRALLGGPLTLERALDRALGSGALLHAIDATLGVEGLPQSGTGQTALLAGVNAAALHGRHQSHFPPVALRGTLAERGIFRRVAEGGGAAAFANAFGAGYWDAVAARRIRRSASVIAAEGAPVRFRDEADLAAGRAVAWDVTGAAMRAYGADTPLITPRHAGRNLARLAEDHELVFFETFLPDLAGHGRLDGGAGTTGHAPANDAPSSKQHQIHYAISLIDGLLGGLLEAMRPQDTMLLTSDHGNVESLASPAHTRNPVPLLAVGPGAGAFSEVTDLSQVADVLVRVALDGKRP